MIKTSLNCCCTLYKVNACFLPSSSLSLTPILLNLSTMSMGWSVAVYINLYFLSHKLASVDEEVNVLSVCVG